MSVLTPTPGTRYPWEGVEPWRWGGVAKIMGGEAGNESKGRTRSRLTPHVRLRRVEAVVNPASGSVGPHAAEMLEEIVAGYGVAMRVADAQPRQIPSAVQAAIAARPDLVIILAGDGTARLAAELAGPEGPLIAPLPGGTMNMLPHALYGNVSWPDALRAALSDGVARPVSGGSVSDQSFYVAAILGSPALWADAREAVRFGRIGLAIAKARRALEHAFATGVRFSLDGGVRQKAEALTLICPLISRATVDETALEAIALDPHNAGEALRLGLRTLFADVIGDWRVDPAVRVSHCLHGRAWTRGRLPALLDGEPHWLDSPADIRFKRHAFRALVPPSAEPVEEVIPAP
jgi:diacylglycerol kinase family enzyme